MHIPRIYHPHVLQDGQTVTLEATASLHICKVMRMENGDKISVFDGQGGAYDGVLMHSHKQSSRVELQQFHPDTSTQKLSINLIQGISRNDRMDFTLQKAVELGVTNITPIWTQYSQRHLSAERMQKRMQHWQAIIINACEQCGQNRLPQLMSAVKFQDWLQQRNTDETLLLLDPDATQSLSALTQPKESIAILIGPEGGLAEEEAKQANQQGATSVRLGSLILRTETAAIAAITAVQTLWGGF